MPRAWAAAQVMSSKVKMTPGAARGPVGVSSLQFRRPASLQNVVYVRPLAPQVGPAPAALIPAG